MSTNKVVLDIDRSIIEKNLLIKSDGEEPFGFASPNEELERLFPLPRTPEERSKVIQLTPGVCVKTKRTEGGGKVFINLCTSEELPEPPAVGTAELASILDSEDPSRFRVPMCLGEPRFDTDKNGQRCEVFDVAVHPRALARLRSEELFRQFLLTATLEGIQEKYKVELDVREVALLSKRKSMGTPKAQRIRAPTGSTPTSPLITEICPAQAQELKPRFRVPKYKIRGEPGTGPKLERMVAEIALGGVLSAADLSVEVGEDRMVVRGERSGYMLDVYLPHLVDQNQVQAQFNRDTKMLLLTLPVQPHPRDQ